MLKKTAILKKAFPVFVYCCWQCSLLAQSSFSIQIQPSFCGKKIALEQLLVTPAGDSLALHTLRFYLSNFTFLKNDRVVFKEENSCYLLDLADEHSMFLSFQLPEHIHVDALQFDLGVDSLTTISGVMGGDLDPTLGMFWAWQSGYIHFKVEGFSIKSRSRDHTFQFHLGGFLPPFQTLQTIQLPISSTEKNVVHLDLYAFYKSIDWTKHSGIMSPCREAVECSKVLAKSFNAHVE